MPEQPTDDQRNAATFAAFSMILGVSGGLLALVAFVIPSILWFVLVPLGLGGLLVLHYVTWGRWLSATLQDDEETSHSSTER